MFYCPRIGSGRGILNQAFGRSGKRWSIVADMLKDGHTVCSAIVKIKDELLKEVRRGEAQSVGRTRA